MDAGDVVLLPLLVVLDGLDAQKDHAQHESEQGKAPSPLLRRVSAHQTPIAMVKLERISMRGVGVPQRTSNWCEPATKAG